MLIPSYQIIVVIFIYYLKPTTFFKIPSTAFSGSDHRCDVIRSRPAMRYVGPFARKVVTHEVYDFKCRV